jgi:hypothetical protein
MGQVPKSMRPTFPLSLVNLLGDPVRKAVLRFDADAMMKLAERLTGLHDFGDADGRFRERLEETIDSANRVDWNTVGRFGVRYILNWHLGNRLRIVELLKQRPELEEIEIERPLVITGLFRTGTTYLQNVLGADPASRAGRLWEFTHPVGRKRDLFGDTKWRRWRGGHVVAMDDLMVPDQAEAHKITVDAFEEDFFLLENDMAHMKFFIGLGDYEHGRSTLDRDMVGPYRWHKRQLQILWAQRSAERWLLKCPWHLWHLRALLTVYPDARVIQTHRNLVDAVGSHCSLSARLASKFQRSLDLHDVGDFWLEYSRAGVERGLEARAGRPQSQFYDVRLADLRAKPIEIVEDIYRHFDLPFDAQLAGRFSERIAEDPSAQLGEHDYDIGNYGLTEERILAEFVDYRQRFGV